MAHNSPNFKKATGLVSSYETAETFRIDPPIAVRDDLQRDVVDARKPGRWAVRQARQFPAVPFREVSLGRANLFFDQIEVVEQPFPGRCDPAVRLDRRRQEKTCSDEDVFVLRQALQELVRSASQTQLVRVRQGLAMMFHLSRLSLPNFIRSDVSFCTRFL